ncbi:transcriptional regulator [Zymomonas mobilis]|uniref:Transcriptional regulator n=1 Tax=Zymomonas mobilis TaxID=542 RepID=A0A542W1A4_ZYMMB|nr:MarR family transcriptional regulator [Zymomonas mobilis]TQL17354.1 transcriptional regulator [Zymomonas mobilis]
MKEAFSSPADSLLFLREPEIRRGIELLYFGYSTIYQSIDSLLTKNRLGQAHYRSLYFIARKPDISVGELLRLLNITKQSLGRVIHDLEEKELIVIRQGERDRRCRLLKLTASGSALEGQLFGLIRDKMAKAYAKSGADAVTGFWQLLENLLSVETKILL